MLESRANESSCDDKANRDNGLSVVSWKPELVADGKVSAAKDTPEKGGANPGKMKDPLKEHVKINDRCSLDIYEHHWELTMPKVTREMTRAELRRNSKGKLELVGTLGEEKVSSDKLIMDDHGIWTMKDDQGQSVQIIDEQMVNYSLDPAHPEKKTQVKQKDFSNGATVTIESNGTMVLIRDQDHLYESKVGTSEYKEERKANRFIVGFSKKDGVTTVFDRNKTWQIERPKPSP